MFLYGNNREKRYNSTRNFNCKVGMSSIGNIRNLTSVAIHTLHRGSAIERIVLGSALLGVGLIFAQKLYRLAIFFFFKRQRSDASPKPSPPSNNKALIEAYEKEIRSLVSSRTPTAAASSPNAPEAQVEHQAHSALAKLTINGVELTDETRVDLAGALYSYDELRKKINGEENRFEFITKS